MSDLIPSLSGPLIPKQIPEGKPIPPPIRDIKSDSARMEALVEHPPAPGAEENTPAPKTIAHTIPNTGKSAGAAPIHDPSHDLTTHDPSHDLTAHDLDRQYARPYSREDTTGSTKGIKPTAGRVPPPLSSEDITGGTKGIKPTAGRVPPPLSSPLSSRASSRASPPSSSRASPRASLSSSPPLSSPPRASLGGARPPPPTGYRKVVPPPLAAHRFPTQPVGFIRREARVNPQKPGLRRAASKPIRATIAQKTEYRSTQQKAAAMFTPGQSATIPSSQRPTHWDWATDGASPSPTKPPLTDGGPDKASIPLKNMTPFKNMAPGQNVMNTVKNAPKSPQLPASTRSAFDKRNDAGQISAPAPLAPSAKADPSPAISGGTTATRRPILALPGGWAAVNQDRAIPHPGPDKIPQARFQPTIGNPPEDPSRSHPTQTKQVGTKPAGTKPPENKQAETNQAGGNRSQPTIGNPPEDPSRSRPTQTNQAGINQAGTKPPENKQAETNQAGANPSHPTIGNPPEDPSRSHPTQTNQAGTKPAETKQAETKQASANPSQPTIDKTGANPAASNRPKSTITGRQQMPPGEKNQKTPRQAAPGHPAYDAPKGTSALDASALNSSANAPIDSAPSADIHPTTGSGQGALGLSENVQKLAAQILVSRTPADGSQVRITVNNAILPETRISLRMEGGALRVDVSTTSNQSLAILSGQASNLQNYLTAETGNDVKIHVHDDNHQDNQGRSRQQYVREDDMDT